MHLKITLLLLFVSIFTEVTGAPSPNTSEEVSEEDSVYSGETSAESNGVESHSLETGSDTEESLEDHSSHSIEDSPESDDADDISSDSQDELSTSSDSSSEESKESSRVTCHASDMFKAFQGADNWCYHNCMHGYCPSTHCTCYRHYNIR